MTRALDARLPVTALSQGPAKVDVPTRHGLSCGCSASNSTDRVLESGPLLIMQRPLDDAIGAALDAVPAERLPSVELTGTPMHVGPTLVCELQSCGFEPEWLTQWLVADATFQARLFSELSGASRLRLRLERTSHDACPRFHKDNVTHRLLCTYRGAGTEYIDPRHLSDDLDLDDVAPAHIRQLPRAAIAVMRGGKNEDASRPGVFHRSPVNDARGDARLLLVIEAADG